MSFPVTITVNDYLLQQTNFKILLEGQTGALLTGQSQSIQYLNEVPINRVYDPFRQRLIPQSGFWRPVAKWPLWRKR